MKSDLQTSSYYPSIEHVSAKETNPIIVPFSNKDMTTYKAIETPISFVVPNISEIARELTEKTQMQVMISMLKQLSPIDIIKLGFSNLTNLLYLAKKDFAAGICLIAQIQMIQAQPIKPTETYLHSQITDTAVSLGNIMLIKRFLKLAKQYNTTPVLMTNNIGPLSVFLNRNKVSGDFAVATYLNNQGYLMNPANIDEIAKQAEISKVTVIARTDKNHLKTDQTLYKTLPFVTKMLVDAK